MIEPKLTPNQQHLREALLHSADFGRAMEVSNKLTIQTADAFNAEHTSMGTSLLARALFVYAMLDIAGNWWADVSGKPMPDTRAAILDLALNMPPIFQGESYLDPNA